FKSTYLTELTISESLKSIGAEAFRNSKLRDLTIPDSLESLGEKAFAAGEFTSATVPVKFIYNIFSWLEHAAALQTLTVTGTGTIGHDPDGIAVSAPLDEYGYIETVIIADTVTGIGEAAFAGLSKLKTVTIGDGVKTIGDNAFGLDGKGCYMLETVNIGSGVKSIGECIFAGWHTEQHATGKLTVNYAGGKIDWNQKVSKRSNWHFDVKTNLVMNYNVK
ncbi:MAG TPA: leucine-rich repeat domain-containing protein, partial [Candidatus Stercoripulliclostridium merdigallinarum]|nr:leucine-rich repeat domain-containing protein [Candidatus Stercoripulliclostridium merdigallinarum]